MNSRNKNTDAILANTDANKELKEAMLKDAEETKNFNANPAAANQGWGLADILMPKNKLTPYATDFAKSVM